MMVLLAATLKVSAILAASLGATTLMWRRSAAERYWVLAVALVCVAAVPVLPQTLPSWRVALAPSGMDGQPEPQMSVATVIDPVGTGLPPAGSEPAAASGLDLRILLPLALPAWIGGVAISLGLLVIGLTRLWWLARRGVPIEQGPWARLADEMGGQLRLRRKVTVLRTPHATLLGTWGVLKPRLLVPWSAATWPEARVRVVLSHELAHVRRSDWLALMGSELLLAVYWFNPLVWIACRRLRHESELACDDAVLSGGVAASEYASHLLAIARTLRTRRAWLPLPAMARRARLEGRINAMLNETVNRTPMTSRARLTSALLLLGLTASIAGLGAQAFFTVTGSLLDGTSRGLAGQAVSLRNIATEAKYEVKSDQTGRFEFVGVPPGEYAMEVRVPGFTVFQDTVTILGRNVDLVVPLEVGSLEETLTVRNEDRPPEDTAGESAVEQQQRREEQRKRIEGIRRTTLEKCEAGAAGATGGRILPPVRLTNPRPVYPENLRAAGVGGVVTMDATIGTEGNIQDIRVVESAHPELETAAVEAVRQWQFTQTLLNCVPIDVHMRVTARFTS
jgi:TonB family protein